MPIKLIDETDHTSVILDKLEYIKEDSYFKISDSNNKSITIQYIPKYYSNWDEKKYDLYIFNNLYLNAEIDIFQIYESSLRSERLGYIFPVELLEANEINYDEDSYPRLKDYKTIAYKKLLETNLTIINNTINDYTISNFFKNCAVCLVNKDTLSKIVGNFNIEDYLLSFHKYGYLYFNEDNKGNNSFTYKKESISEIKGRKRITIKKSKFDINSNDYIKSLFKDHLLQSDNHFVRFILLYQILEHFIESEFNKEFEIQLEAYKNGYISKNDLKEKISNISAERKLINTVLNRIEIKEKIKEKFTNECSSLFSSLNIELKKNSFANNVYDLRNLITHRLRMLTNKEKKSKKIIEIFESIIIEVLINYTDTSTNN